MLALNATFIIVFISFVLFMLLMRGVFFEPVAGILAQRSQKLADDREAIESSQVSCAQLTAQYQQSIAGAQRKAQAVLQASRDEARKQVTQLLEDARQQAQRDVEAQLAELKTWQANTMTQLVSEKEGLVQLVIQKIRHSQAGPLGAPELAESGASTDV
jgi:F-type H+-transporting ATPase subunit b